MITNKMLLAKTKFEVCNEIEPMYVKHNILNKKSDLNVKPSVQLFLEEFNLNKFVPYLSLQAVHI